MDKFKWDYVLLIVLIALLSRVTPVRELNLEELKKLPPLTMSWEILPYRFISVEESFLSWLKNDAVEINL